MSSDELLVLSVLFIMAFFAFVVMKIRSRLPQRKKRQADKRRKSKHVHRPRPHEEFWKSLGVTIASDEGVSVPAAAQGPTALKAREAEASKEPTTSVASDDRGKDFKARAEKAHDERHYVEAYFWALKAQYDGSRVMEKSLMRYRAEWLCHGKPEEKDNVREDFTAWSGSFARAAMRIQCKIHPHKSLARIKELAAAGHKESRQYMRRRSKNAGKVGESRHGHHVHHAHK